MSKECSPRLKWRELTSRDCCRSGEKRKHMNEPVLRELARITARCSVTLFIAALFAFASRRRPRVAAAYFSAFLAAHAVHFSIVLLLAYATGGANLRSRGGYTLTIGVGFIFAVGAVFGLLRLRVSEPTRAL